MATTKFWNTNIGKTIKATVYAAVSAGLAYGVTATANDPALFGAATVLINTILVLVQKTFFDSTTRNLGSEN